ncbi:MerR family transcriptional regulator [Devosia nitrariae]|uniref:HTH merR-type domain-containing protein n=1 Tax=Devosia nitrariae TaxID=2071872 RepID=A0ABQ5W0F9_9HYPH|nr:MerR family transcriptional regulator [Devosia nitrariae]GLQ53400.1 hypothetical protein GCM10010862_06580 [Devosia nitrariae]
MNSSARFLSPSEAAKRLGISAKALRLYEQRGLLTPVRTAAGWRTYGPDEMARAGDIAVLRALGLSVAQVARVLEGDPGCLEPALETHQATLEGQVRRLMETADKVRALRSELAEGRAPVLSELPRLVRPQGTLSLAFDLPWPLGGERFELSDVPPLTYITGPLASGKTRLARMIAQNLPDAAFIGLERLEDAEARGRLEADPVLKQRVDEATEWLCDEGTTRSPALLALLMVLEDAGEGALIVDLVEEGLDGATQEALVSRLRQRSVDARPLFLMTRSSSISTSPP